MHPQTQESVINLRKQEASAAPLARPENAPAKSPAPATSAPSESTPHFMKQTQALVEWRALEFEKYEKDIYWTLTLVVATVIIAAYFVLTKNYLGAGVISLCGFLVYVYAFKDPQEISFAVSPLGVQIENKMYEYSRLKSFWVLYNPPDVKEVVLVTKQSLTPYLYLPLGDTNPVAIRNILVRFLPEKEHHEAFVNTLARRLHF